VALQRVPLHLGVTPWTVHAVPSERRSLISLVFSGIAP